MEKEKNEKKLISEFLGTYFLVFAGTGAVVIDEIAKSLTHVGVAISFGLVVMVLIYTFGHTRHRNLIKLKPLTVLK
jgi:aquaporin NIP